MSKTRLLIESRSEIQAIVQSGFYRGQPIKSVHLEESVDDFDYIIIETYGDEQ